MLLIFRRARNTQSSGTGVSQEIRHRDRACSRTGRDDREAGRGRVQSRRPLLYILTGTYITTSRSLMPLNAVEPLEPNWLLPEVKDPKNWWGGHIWGDKSGRLLLYPTAFAVDNLWYNADMLNLTTCAPTMISKPEIEGENWPVRSPPRRSGPGADVLSLDDQRGGFPQKARQSATSDRRPPGRGRCARQGKNRADHWCYLLYISAVKSRPEFPLNRFHVQRRGLM